MPFRQLGELWVRRLRQIGTPDASRVNYLLHDEFMVNRAAGSINGTEAEPGLGIRLVNDTEDKLSISNGLLSMDKVAVPADYGDPMIIWPTAISRPSGRLLIYQCNYSTAGNIRIGWNDDALLTTVIHDGIKWTGTSILNFFGSTDGANIATVAPNTDYIVTFCLKNPTGGYIFLEGGAFANHTLLWIAPLDTDDPIYPCLTNYNQVMTFDYMRVPADLWLPTPLGYDTFTRSDGAIANTETTGPDGQAITARTWQSGGATWTVSSNEAINTPSTGSELITDGALENWSSPTNLTNWNETANGASTVNQDGADKHGGSFSARLDIDVAANAAAIYQAATAPVGTWMRYDFWIKVSDAAKYGRVLETAFLGTFNPTSWTNYVMIGRRSVANDFAAFGRNPGDASFSIWYDDISVKALTLNTLFSSVEVSTTDVLAQVELDTVVAKTQAGIVLSLDDKDAPANFVIAYHDGTNAKLEKCVAGTYTTLISAAATYAAGAILVVTKDGTSYSLYYNKVKIGATQTVSDAGIVSNTLHGMFSTYSGNQLDNFQVFPRGTNGEYARLNSF